MTLSPNPLRAGPSQDAEDSALALAAAAGDAAALDTLVRRHHPWVHTVALRFLLNPADAADLAQEAMLRVVTRIAQFEGRASFRTWAYRIVLNAFLDARRGRLETQVTSFAAYGEALDGLPLEPLNLAEPFEAERRLIVEEAKIGCMLGMLLCLNREQRLAYILGEVMETPSDLAAAVLDITPAAFRKRLERARGDLVAFMTDKCGLMREANPCRCERKTTAFIRAGWVDPFRMKFVGPALEAIRAEAPQASAATCALEDRAATLFRAHPVHPGPDLAGRIRALLAEESVATALRLEDGP